MNTTYRKLSNLGKCPSSHVESADPCKRMLVLILVKERCFGWWERVSGFRVYHLWLMSAVIWFSLTWLVFCRDDKISLNYLDSTHNLLRNCVIGSLSGAQAASYVSVWKAGFCQLPWACLPRLWRGWVSWAAEPSAMEGKGRDWIVECADRKEGSLYDSCLVPHVTAGRKKTHPNARWQNCILWELLLWDSTTG